MFFVVSRKFPATNSIVRAEVVHQPIRTRNEQPSQLQRSLAYHSSQNESPVLPSTFDSKLPQNHKGGTNLKNMFYASKILRYVIYIAAQIYTASRLRGAARKISSTLYHEDVRLRLNYMDTQRKDEPDDHFSSFTRAENDLALEFVALGDPQLPHRSNGSPLHI